MVKLSEIVLHSIEFERNIKPARDGLFRSSKRAGEMSAREHVKAY